MDYKPIDVAKLMFPTGVLGDDCDVKRSTRRYGTTDSGHNNDRYGVERDVSGRLRHEHEALIQTVQVPFVRFDAALYT